MELAMGRRASHSVLEGLTPFLVCAMRKQGSSPIAFKTSINFNSQKYKIQGKEENGAGDGT